MRLRAIERWDDRELVAADRRVAQAWHVLYERHHVAVTAFLARRVDRETARELCSEVFAAAYLARDRFDPRLGGVRAWLLGIAANKAVDALRRTGRERAARERLGIEPRPPVDAGVAELEGLIAAREMVEFLPRAQRVAVLERVVLDRDYGDMAAADGVAPATVRKRVSEGLRLLAGAYS